MPFRWTEGTSPQLTTIVVEDVAFAITLIGPIDGTEVINIKQHF